jgi:hypothetical protein
MTDHPIMFSRPMIEALLDGRKTQTRRLAWRWPKSFGDSRPIVGTVETRGEPTPWQRVKVGDRLWVRENFWRWGRWIGTKTAGNVSHRFEALPDSTGSFLPVYAAGQTIEPDENGSFADAEPTWHLRPCIFLERKHSRITLTITATKIERVQAISEPDAVAEGLVAFASGETRCVGVKVEGGYSPYGLTGRECFMNLWCDLHGPRSWADDPEVVALAFSVHVANIDSLKEAA